VMIIKDTSGIFELFVIYTGVLLNGVK
jgi:hypothetical protein